jgi:hypothetical protein
MWGAGQHRQPERALEVDGHGLVEQFLAHRVQALVQRGHAGVADQDIDAA